ncbi:Heterokaryon incompatibility protein 6, OR allele [Pseudocercospora fuligena]|uniref:Heterokaryon incompatibility protein 6, OR allele n=1 Tax=Pseudocercospora fuligena TaxID=685502 RepID=A0A8H6R6W5_9PEZI|nr:Heterokaryon incompatibility protein 6, OR allele [Pseudocercospora fuligena]
MSYLTPKFRTSGSLTQPEPQDLPSSSWNMPLSLSALKVWTIKQVGSSWESHSKWLYDVQGLATSEHSRLKGNLERKEAIWRTAVSEHDLLWRANPGDSELRLVQDLVDRLCSLLSDQCFSSMSNETLRDAGYGLYADAVARWGKGRRPFLTNNGHLGCGPEMAEVGDHVVIVLGAEVPYVIRKCPDGEHYALLGDAYVHGAMDGEFADPDFPVSRITLV